VITSSTDEDARIIFGAVIDEKLKDEIKITVVATGFDNTKSNSDISIADSSSAYTPSEFLRTGSSTDEDKTEEPRKKNKISPLKAAQAEPAKSKKEDDEEEEDDELGIPAFIRKKMM